MPDLKKKVIAVVLGFTVMLSVAACNGEDDPSDGGGDTATTEPVGS